MWGDESLNLTQSKETESVKLRLTFQIIFCLKNHTRNETDRWYLCWRLLKVKQWNTIFKFLNRNLENWTCSGYPSKCLVASSEILLERLQGRSSKVGYTWNPFKMLYYSTKQGMFIWDCELQEGYCVWEFIVFTEEEKHNFSVYLYLRTETWRRYVTAWSLI